MMSITSVTNRKIPKTTRESLAARHRTPPNPNTPATLATTKAMHAAHSELMITPLR